MATLFHKYFLLNGIFVLLLTNFIYSQEANLQKRITIEADNKLISDILNEISIKAGVYFAYNNQQIPMDKTITIYAKKQPIATILNTIFEDLQIDYSIVEKQIVLKPRITKNETAIKPLLKQTISGYLRDKETGEVLIGAAVYVTSLDNVFTYSNAYGYYSLTLPSNTYTINYSFLGYKTISTTIQVNKNMMLNYELEPNQTILEEVVINATNNSNISDKTQMSQNTISTQVISKMPGLLGESDFIKSLQTIPGIKHYSDGSTAFYVRGGDRDQNLILIDEAPVYNPCHLLGFFSSFIPDAMKDVKIYKGDIPAWHGGRLSSLIDIKTKEGNLKQPVIYGNIGLLSTTLSLEAPIIKEKSSFFMSFRRSLLEGVFASLRVKNLNLYFFDYTSKANLRINDNNRLYFSFYISNDFFTVRTSDSTKYGIRWGNYAASIRWNHLFNRKLFCNTTAYGSLYNYFLYINYDKNNFWKSEIGNIGLKTDFTWYTNPNNTIRSGFSLQGFSFNPGNMNYNSLNTTVNLPHIPMYYSRELAFYSGNEQKITKNISLRYGLRMSIWQNVGKTTYYLFNSVHQPYDTITADAGKPYYTNSNLEPRLSINYSLTKNSCLKASYNFTSQYLQLPSNSISPFTSLEVWIPAGPNIKPQKANQFALGYFNKFTKPNIELNIENFYKLLYNQIECENHAQLLLNPLMEGELHFGKAWAYGIELMISKNTKKLSGWASYTYSRTFKRITEINNNIKYPAMYDRPHYLSIFAIYNITNRLGLTTNFIYCSGIAYSVPTSFYYYQNYTLPYYSKKNNARLPDYHRLDIGLNYKLNKNEQKFTHSIALSVYNVYARKNPISINFNKIERNGNYTIPANLLYVPNIVTTELSLITFIPSLSYSFKF